VRSWPPEGALRSRFHAVRSDLESQDGGLSEDEVPESPQPSLRLGAGWRTPAHAPPRRAWGPRAAVGLVGAAGGVLVGLSAALAVAAGLAGAWLLLA
jgi:hypothetical protein